MQNGKGLIERGGQIWNYFKKGRNEVGLVLTLYNMILTYSIKFDVDVSLFEYAALTVIFFGICWVLGIFLAERIEPENNRISPYAQDNLQSAIYLQQSLIDFYNGDIDAAISNMNEAQVLRVKWLR